MAARLSALLDCWSATDSEQDSLGQQYREHLRCYPDSLWRSGSPDHFTASCFVFDQDWQQVALTLHRKAKLWLQFGGHFEQTDPSPGAAALREGREESGLAELTLVQPQPVDLHWHQLDAAFGSCRSHLDLAFAALAPPGAQLAASSESLAVAWWPISALPKEIAPDLPGRLVGLRQLLTQ